LAALLVWSVPASAQYMRITTDNPANNLRLKATGTTLKVMIGDPKPSDLNGFWNVLVKVGDGTNPPSLHLQLRPPDHPRHRRRVRDRLEPGHPARRVQA